MQQPRFPKRLSVLLYCCVSLVFGSCPVVLAKELGVVEDLYIGRHAILPFGGIGRFQNLLTKSEAFDDDDAWSKPGVTVTANSATAPNGTTTADQLADNASAGTVVSQASSVAAASKTFVGSLWLRTTTGTATVILLVDSNGTATSADPNTSASVTTDWQRFFVKKTFGTGTGNARFVIDVGTAQNVLAWGAQLEEAQSPGVYVRTTTAAVGAGQGVISDGNLLGSGTGDVTDLGNCASGPCFTGASGSSLTFDGGLNDGTLNIGSLTAARTWTLPDITGTILLAQGSTPGTQQVGNLNISGTALVGGGLDVEGTITAGSGNTVITTGTGLLDATKLSGDVPQASLTQAVKLQAATPGTQQTGHLNLSGTGIFGTSLQLGTETLDDPLAGVLSVSGDLRLVGNDLQDSGGNIRLTMATASPQLTFSGNVAIAGNLSLGDTRLLDLSAILPDTTSEGLKLPQAAVCSAPTAEGQVCWDTNDEQLFIGTSTGVQLIGGPTTGDVTNVGSCTTTVCLPLDGSTHNVGLSTQLIFEGTNDINETILTVAGPTLAGKTITLPDLSGTALLLQTTTPGTQQEGHINLSGTGLFGGNLSVTGNFTQGSSGNTTQLTTTGITYAGTARPKRSVILTAAGAITPTGGAASVMTNGANFSYYTVDFADGATKSSSWQFVVPDSLDPELVPPGQTPLQTAAGTPVGASLSDQNMGYRFTPNKNGRITHLGCYSNDGITKTVRLYTFSDGVVRASVSCASNGSWVYTPLGTPFGVTSGTSYVVAVRSGAGNYMYKSVVTPLTSGDITINDSRIIFSSDEMPNTVDDLFMYGWADVRFEPSPPLLTDVTLYWISSATSGAVRWEVAMDGKGTTTAFDTALTAASTNAATNSTANALSATTFTGITTGWDDSEVAVVKVSRIGADPGDTMTGVAKLVMVKIEWTASTESD